MPWVALGRIGRPHGVGGELRFFPYNPDSELIDGLETVRLQPDGPDVRVVSVRPGGQGPLLRLEGVSDRNAAAALVNREVFVDREILPEPDDGWYLVDLVGLRVVDTEGTPLGEVVGVLEAGPQDLLEVRREGRLWLLPAVEPLLQEVDPEAGRLVVSLPEGLLDLEEGA